MSSLTYSDSLDLDLQAYAHDNEKVETAIQTLESLTYTQELMTDGDKGLDETAYKLVQHSVECFLRLGRIGGEPNKVIPDLQSFKTHDISHAALEGFGEGIKNVFMSIINAIKKAFQWVWGLIKRIFTRNKDHEEKTADLKHKAEEVKAANEKKTDEQKKDGPYPIGSNGFYTKCDLSKPEILKHIVTTHGIMDGPYLGKIGSEMLKVFGAQHEMNRKAKESMLGDKPTDDSMPVPFEETREGKVLTAARGKNGELKVYASEEFGDNTFVTVQMLPPPKYDAKSDDVMKQNLRWVDGLKIQKTKVEGIINLNKYAVLEGDFANPDKLIENIQYLNSQLKACADKVKQYQVDKEAFIKGMEAKIKKIGANLFSTKEKKNDRDIMLYDLKFFQKTMDQPALMYYGLVDGVVNSFINLAQYVLAFNNRSGNHVDLKKDGH
ncbi:hypothetical protein [Burkholderia phage FLC6]|nr:hypothetical protein [Burkholderia phage FLC6]BDD79468.1 hypothetical protein [Burkholderia phage FLC8]